MTNPLAILRKAVVGAGDLAWMARPARVLTPGKRVPPAVASALPASSTPRRLIHTTTHLTGSEDEELPLVIRDSEAQIFVDELDLAKYLLGKVAHGIANHARNFARERRDRGGQKTDPESFYTMQLEMPSIADVVGKGWPVIGAEQLSKTSSNARVPLIVFMGRYSSGKSYLLEQMLRVDERTEWLGNPQPTIKVSPAPSTSGIGFKYHNNTWFLDTEGSLAPAIIDVSNTSDRENDRSDETNEIERILSLGKAKQFLIERVVRRLGDAIVIVLDKITEEDQQQLLELVQESDTSSQVFVICNFKDNHRSEELIDHLKRSFNASEVDTSKQEDYFHGVFGGSNVGIYAIWKDCDETPRSIFPNFTNHSGSRDSARNTETLKKLMENLPEPTNNKLKKLDDGQRPLETAHALFRVVREITKVLPDLVHLEDPETTDTSWSDANAHSKAVKIPDPWDGKTAVKVVYKNKKVMTHRLYRRFNVLYSHDDLPMRVVQTDGQVDYDIAVPGCEICIGKKAVPSGDAYVKVRRVSNSKGDNGEEDGPAFEIRAKLRTWEEATDPNGLEADRKEMRKRIPLFRDFPRFATIAELKKLNETKDGVLRLRAYKAIDDDDDDDE